MTTALVLTFANAKNGGALAPLFCVKGAGSVCYSAAPIAETE